MLPIESMLLNTVIQVQCVFQGLSVTCGSGIFRKAIDGKADGIELLLRILGLSLIIEAPIHTPIFGIDEVLDDIVLGTCRHIQILRLTQHSVGSRESPEDAGIQDGSLVSIFMQHIAVVNTSIEAAMLLILHTVDPKPQDIVLQHLAHLLLQRFNLCHFLIG